MSVLHRLTSVPAARFAGWCVRRLVSVALGLGVLSGAAMALPSNPNPAIFGGDNGASVFSHGPLALAVEQSSLDNPASLPIFFGFYFDGTGGLGTNGPDSFPNAGIIFNSGVITGQAALLDFVDGAVLDADPVTFAPTGNITSAFTKSPTGSGNIGFFISVLVGGNFVTLYTDPALNGGVDAAAVFPALSNPNIFDVAFDFGTGVTVYSVLLLPLTAVPEPSPVMLLAAFAAIALLARRKLR